MNTKHAETETAIERMNTAFERLRTDMARRDNLLIFVTLVGLAVATAVLGILITAQ